MFKSCEESFLKNSGLKYSLNTTYNFKKKTNRLPPALVFHGRLLSWLIPGVLPPDISRNRNRAPSQLRHLPAQPGNKVWKHEIRNCARDSILASRCVISCEWGTLVPPTSRQSQLWKNSDLFPKLTFFLSISTQTLKKWNLLFYPYVT